MPDLIPRLLADELLRQLDEFPIVTVLGPRQAGKTTLVRMSLPDHAYTSLETPRLRVQAEEDPVGFLADHPAPVILDEIQRVPQLLSYLQEIVDEDGGSGRYVLAGSHQLSLREAVSQSLAGRTSILHLLPLSIPELAAAGIAFGGIEDYLFHGFLPRIHHQRQRPPVAYGSYLQTYVERDVRLLIRLKDASLFEKFLHLLAGRAGQLADHRSLANDVGVDAKTIGHWLSILEASHVIFQLPPYFENFGKRSIKSPKYYFTEPGLLVNLLGIETAAQVRRDPLVGGLFENLVVLECLKARYNAGRAANLYFFRDKHGREIDLLHAAGRDLAGFEIKSASTWNGSFRRNLDHFHDRVHPLVRRAVVYSGERMGFSDGVVAEGFREAHALVEG